MAESAGRVRFAEGTQLEPEGVRVEPNNSRYQLPEAHLGILRNHHTYHADVPITHKLGMDVTIDQPTYNQYIRILEVLPTEQQEEGTFHTMVKVEIKTVKDGRIREKFLLNTNKDQTMEVLVTAQVIESSKGHPLLKDGIHLISHEVEDESEWPGHSSH